MKSEASEGRKKWGVKIYDIHVLIQKNCGRISPSRGRETPENWELFVIWHDQLEVVGRKTWGNLSPRAKPDIKQGRGLGRGLGAWAVAYLGFIVEDTFSSSPLLHFPSSPFPPLFLPTQTV